MDSTQSSLKLLDAKAMAASIKDVAKAISAEFLRDGACKDLAFIGIQRHGVEFARRVAAEIGSASSVSIPVGALDINMYRDDIGMRKSLLAINETIIPFDINNRAIILADDVLQSGRTIRAALDAITDYGRPALIRLTVLIDRGLREFPIQADYVGARLDVPAERRVKVKWLEIDGEDAVCSIEKPRTGRDAG